MFDSLIYVFSVQRRSVFLTWKDVNRKLPKPNHQLFISKAVTNTFNVCYWPVSLGSCMGWSSGRFSRVYNEVIAFLKNVWLSFCFSFWLFARVFRIFIQSFCFLLPAAISKTVWTKFAEGSQPTKLKKWRLMIQLLTLKADLAKHLIESRFQLSLLKTPTRRIGPRRPRECC